MMSSYQTVLDSKRSGRAPSLSQAGVFVRLMLALILLPLAANAQSSIDVETAPGMWTFCSGAFEPGSVFSPLTDPAMPGVGDDILFRIRMNPDSSGEMLELLDIAFGPSFQGPFSPLTESEVQFGSVRSLPALVTSQEEFDLFFIPRDAGVYRFNFIGEFWDGGQCSVYIPAGERACLISTIEGIDQDGNAFQNALDFGTVPVGQSVDGILLFGFAQPFLDDGINFTPVSPPFQLAPTFELSPDLDLAEWDVSFAPTSEGIFEQTVTFVAVSDSENAECHIEVLLEGRGELANLSITYGDPVCGDTLAVPVTLSNPSSVSFDNLDARATTGFNLAPDPPGSFSGRNFILGPAGSMDPPSQRQFTLFYPLSGGVPPNPQITITRVTSNTEVLLQEPIPQAGCIQILEPENLTLDFGDVVVNNAAPNQSIIVANRGTFSETVSALLAQSGQSQGFGLGQGGTSATLIIPPASQETLPVSFLPPSIGPKQSMVNFSSSVTPDIPSVRLLGNGVDEPLPALRYEVSGVPINPGSTIRFPATQVGQSSTLPLQVTNIGNTGALGLDLNAVNGEFNVSDSSPPELAPNQSASYTLTFNPAQAGARNGQLTISGENFDMALFRLEGDGVMGAIDIDGVGLSANVTPAQTPLPTVGLELQGGPATQTLEGDLLLDFVPNLSQTPEGFLDGYQAVRFMAGSGEDGRSMRFRFMEGQQRALFPAEGAEAQLASFQSGTVAGSIQFRLANVQTLEGVPVPITDPLAGSVTVEQLAPVIRSMTTPSTATGINLVVEAVSTPREITGVCLSLSAASGTELTFTRPDAGFLNDAFSQWFLQNPASFAPGGAFLLTIPIDLSNPQTFGSAELWLRNAQGWSGPNSPCP